MPINSLRIKDFRNLQQIELVPCSPGLNIIYGNNGSGKTSLLETIYYLGLGRSFRSSTAMRLIRSETDRFNLFAHILSDNERRIPIGIERELNGATRLRIAEKDISQITELAYLLPIRLINSQSHNVFEAGPVFRRKFLDWGLFYQSDNFLPCWRNYERVLKQRNAVLRDRLSKRELDPWTDELVRYGLEFDTLRRAYVEALTPYILEIAETLLPISNLEICYQPGWSENRDFSAVLADHYQEELRAGYTLYGPHRADLDIKIKGVSAKHFLSRGQQKLLICAMILSQGKLVAKYANKGLIYLVDDLPSELDLQSRQQLISLLSNQRSQIFITAIESDTISDFLTKNSDQPMKVFHVEHGNVVEQRMERQ